MNVENERYSKIRLFEIFVDALRHFVQQDNELFFWHRNKAAVVHRLASHLHVAFRKDLSLHADETNETYMELPGKLYFDVGTTICIDQKNYIADILLHNRSIEKPVRLLAIICRDTYLSEDEQTSLYELQENGNCELVLALSFLPQKNYLLIYRAGNSKMEYYHFLQDELSCNLLKQREIENSEDAEQLKLGISVRRKRKTTRQPDEKKQIPADPAGSEALQESSHEETEASETSSEDDAGDE